MHHTISYKTKIALVMTVILWSSAYVGIRAALHDFSPAGLAVFRYLIAGLVMFVFYVAIPNKNPISFIDKIKLLAVGAFGIGVYNLALNLGEVTVSAGVASFMISQSPLITTLLAIFLFSESVTIYRVAGFCISLPGVILIAVGYKNAHFDANQGLLFIVLATIAGSFYTILQKPFLRKYSPIHVTAFMVWGGALFLLFYLPMLQSDFSHASIKGIMIVTYLGIFPAAIAYLAWGYVLIELPASRAVSFLYFMPFVTTLMGWLFLGELPTLLSLIGGITAVLGVFIINYSYRRQIEKQLQLSSR